eukprot:TRINITY_DN6669_c0_g1_i1.p1 TRINITY_DN6669_c0_g1~~TRINITY_DN6669_c0_g1_i1.p1  ORF type:complete len:152 (+),score=27.64 TRINITY_DN6669_c0_g1_i1:217-672(+)
MYLVTPMVWILKNSPPYKVTARRNFYSPQLMRNMHHKFMNGLLDHFSTDQCSTPLKRSLIPICVEQLMELCSRGFIPISVQLGYVNPDSEKKKEFVVGYVPKEWITEIGKNLQKWCYVWATDEDGKLEANFYSPEDLQEEFFVHTVGGRGG